MLFYGRLLNALPLLPILGPTKLNQVTLKELPEGAPRRSIPRYSTGQKKRVACDGYPILKGAN